jgi:hypothetical protein
VWFGLRFSCGFFRVLGLLLWNLRGFGGLGGKLPMEYEPYDSSGKFSL